MGVVNQLLTAPLSSGKRMISSTPLPLPPACPKASKRLNPVVTGAILGLSALAGLAFVALWALRVSGFLIPYSIPTGSMSPAINAGDSFFVEGITYLARKPARGDIVVFKTEGFAEPPRLPGFKLGPIFAKRLVGVPGDHLRIANGVLYVNCHAMSFHNRAGEIHYVHFPGSRYIADDSQAVVVPANCYFVLGDHSERSGDSRSYGFVSKDAVLGRAAFCYWPLKHLGSIQ